MSKIEKVFNEEGKKLITYITAGDYNLDFTYDAVIKMEEAGANIIELGIPYSDPLADGPIIQRASQRALVNNINLDSIFSLLEDIRRVSQIPIVFLIYYNLIYSYGVEKFILEASKKGLDGLIIPDLPLEERKELIRELEKTSIDLIPLVAPTSKNRIKDIVMNSSGFIYCVSSRGVTGVRNNLDTDLDDFIKNVKSKTDLPIAIGFGVSGPDMARDLSKICDAVIVGSAIIEQLEEGLKDDTSLEKIYEFTKILKESII